MIKREREEIKWGREREERKIQSTRVDECVD